MHLVALLAGQPEEFERVMEQGTRDLVAAAKDAGVQRFVLMSALGATEETKDLVPYYHAKWEMEQTVKGSGLEYVIFRPSFIFGRRWRRAAAVRPDREARARHADRRARHAADSAHLDRRRRPRTSRPASRSRGREQDVRARRAGRGQLERVLVAPEAARSASAGRRSTCPSALMRAQAVVLEKLPNPPVTRDQLKMLAAGDNVVSNSDAVDTFGLPLVPLDEQLRRSTSGLTAPDTSPGHVEATPVSG